MYISMYCRYIGLRQEEIEWVGAKGVQEERLWLGIQFSRSPIPLEARNTRDRMSG